MAYDNNKISLIIPSISNSFFINDLLTNIYLWSSYPSEIILINTSGKKILVDKFLKKKIKIDIKIINKKNLYPGAARNLGILNSRYNYIVFLDMNTVPYSRDWLKNNFRYLLKNKLDGLYGQTYYLANSYNEKIIRASTFGRSVLTTIPGSIYSKKTINLVGKFNSSTRAGEDTEWLERLNLLNFKIKKCVEPIYYKGLYNVSYLEIIKKWFRNYSFSANLPHLSFQKNLYLLLLFIFVFLGVFNWNSSNINWNFGIEIFVPHITKIFLAVCSLIYLVLRGFFIPLKKKVKINYLLPINIFTITLFSFILDITKLLAFFLSFLIKKKNLNVRKKLLKQK